jgi:predicted GTPase
LETLVPGDKILIAEACTHHQQPDDIGKVKIPLVKTDGRRRITDRFFQRFQLSDNLDEYKLIIHCGGCMLNRKEMLHRIHQAKNRGIPIVNYGVLIAAVMEFCPELSSRWG